MTAVAEPRRRPRRAPELTFLRLVPGNTVVHRLWAGTKVLVATMLALTLSISPTWAMVGIGAGIVLLALLAGRIPIGAFPRLPRWFFLLLLVGAVLNLFSGTDPTVDVGGISVSLGGVEEWARFMALAVVLITSGAVIGWTTPLGDVAPALRTLFRPLRWLRLPVDEWVLAIALAIRCLPMLIDEIRTLAAAIRLRVHPPEDDEPKPELTFRQLLIETHNLLATAIVTSMRRAHDLAEAMVARGGMGGAVSATTRSPRYPDYIVIVGMFALCAVCLVVLHL